MQIIELTQTQFRNYSNIHTSRNFGQTLEYARLEENNKKAKYYLGLIDSSGIIHAATCILVANISSLIKEAIAKDGFLIDYADFYLVEEFIKELTKYLKKIKVTYLTVDPVFKYKVYNKENKLIENNVNILDNLIRLGFIPKGYQNEFSKYDVIIENYNSINDIYNRFNRNTKRNIKTSINMGITLHKGSNKDLKIFYEMVKKKKKINISYYENMMNVYNTKENKMELFFTKLNIHNFLVNSKKLYDKEKEKNEKIVNKIMKRKDKIDNKLYNIKTNSDHTLNKYHEQLEIATKLNQNGESEIIIGTTAIIRNNNEIYFLIDGFNDKYRNIYSSHVLKWAIIKKYFEKGYTKFNLGEIHNNYYAKANKYYHQYTYKIGFGGNIIEYPETLRLIINKPVYNTYSKFHKM